jgi:hypothetical protein
VTRIGAIAGDALEVSRQLAPVLARTPQTTLASILPMGLDAKHAMGGDENTFIADRGYYNGDQVLVQPRSGAGLRGDRRAAVHSQVVYRDQHQDWHV